MKRLVPIVCVVVAVLFAAAVVYAQTSAPPQKQMPAQQAKPEAKPAPTKEPMTKQAEKMMPKGKEKMMPKTMMMGEVVSIDAVANTLVVKGKKGDVIFMIMPETKIMIAGKEAMLADVKKDSKVAVTYKWEGKKRVATTVKTG